MRKWTYRCFSSLNSLSELLWHCSANWKQSMLLYVFITRDLSQDQKNNLLKVYFKHSMKSKNCSFSEELSAVVYGTIRRWETLNHALTLSREAHIVRFCSLTCQGVLLTICLPTSNISHYSFSCQREAQLQWKGSHKTDIDENEHWHCYVGTNLSLATFNGVPGARERSLEASQTGRWRLYVSRDPNKCRPSHKIRTRTMEP